MNEKKRGSLSLDFGVRGWLVIIYCFLSMTIPGAFLGVWQITVSTNAMTLGWNSTAVLSLMSIAGVIMCVLELLLSKKLARTTKLSMISAVTFLIFGLCCLGMGFTSTDVILYNVFFVIGYICSQAQSVLMNNMICGKWWPKRRTVVVGITTIGICFGAAIGNGLYTVITAAVGTTGMYIAYFVVALIVCLIGFVFVRDYPEQVGAYPDNDQSVSREELAKEFAIVEEAQKNSPWNLKNLVKTPQVWIIILASLVTFNINGIFMAQTMNRLVNFGTYDMMQAIGLITTASIVACFGSPLCGVIDAKLGTKGFVVVILILSAIASLTQFSSSYNVILVGAVIAGVVAGGSSNVVLTLCAEAFPRESIGHAMAAVQPIMHLIVMGLNESYLLVADAANGYAPVYIFFAVLAGVSAILIGVFYKPEKIKERDLELKAARR